MATFDAFSGKSLAETFPTELSSIICQYLIEDRLPKDDLANFRLTSKSCAVAATPYLFQSQHVSLMLKSLQNLQSISKQPHLASHVKEIWYEPRLMYSLDRQSYSGLVRKTTTPEEMERGWSMYWDWLCQQNYLVESDYQSAVLTMIFHRLTNLRKIVIEEDVPVHYSSVRIAQQVFLEGKELFCDTPGKWLSEGRQMKHQGTMGSKCLEASLHACSLAETKLTSLTCDSVGEIFFKIQPEFMPLSVFQHLRDLNITIFYAHTYENRRTSDAANRGLNRVLRSAVHLATLDITIYDAEAHDDRNKRCVRGPFWDEAVNGVVLPKLKSLKLCEVSGGRDSFIEFFTQHAASLEYLSMEKMYLMEELTEWYRVFHVIMTIMTCSVHLRDSWEGCWAESHEEPDTPSLSMMWYIEGTKITFRRALETYLMGQRITVNESSTLEELWEEIITTCEIEHREAEEERENNELEAFFL